MNNPPGLLDGAEVVQWAVSSSGEFYQLPGSEPPITVVAMTVCRYGEDGPVYLFKCDANWHVVQDWDSGSVEDVAELAVEHANGKSVEWQRFSKAGTGPKHLCE